MELNANQLIILGKVMPTLAGSSDSGPQLLEKPATPRRDRDLGS